MLELAFHLLDLLENACEAGAKEVDVEICEDTGRDELLMKVVDDGRGMTEEEVQKAFDPFFTTRVLRRVGLGLPLLKAAAERAGGSVSLVSRPGHTEVVARFIHSHIDRAPLGDVASSLVAFLLNERQPRLCYRHCVNDKSFAFDSAEIKGVLGSPGHPSVIRWLQSYISENISLLREGVTP